MIRRALCCLRPRPPAYTTPREMLHRASGLTTSADYADLQDAGVVWIARIAYVDGWDAVRRVTGAPRRALELAHYISQFPAAR